MRLQNVFKSFFRNVYVVLKGIGYSRAAAAHARSGDYKKAREILNEYDKCLAKYYNT